MYVNAWYTNESRPYEHAAIGETREKDKEEKDERVANASLIHKDQRDRVNCTHVKCMHGATNESRYWGWSPSLLPDLSFRQRPLRD